ncbi:MAG: hydrogen gas-evolving membrane-bound hydrogenase subunit E [candidate division WOR-3 bacterium]
MIELYLLLLAMLASALVAIETKDLLASAISMGLVGFAVAIMFILVQAPDLAIVQIVVEILSVIFFAAVILRTTHIDTTIGKGLDREMVFPIITFFVFGTLFFIFSLYALKDLPRFGEPIMRVANTYIKEGLEKTGAANLVAAIILDYRGYDTLGEATVLFTAVLGVLVVLRKVGRK